VFAQCAHGDTKAGDLGRGSELGMDERIVKRRISTIVFMLASRLAGWLAS